MFICIHTHVYMLIYAPHTQTFMHTYTHALSNSYMLEYTSTHMNVYTHTYTYTQACCTPIHVRIYLQQTYAYTYLHGCAHTFLAHMYTHAHSRPPLRRRSAVGWGMGLPEKPVGTYNTHSQSVHLNRESDHEPTAEPFHRLH